MESNMFLMDRVHSRANKLFLEVLERYKKEHNSTDSLYELEVKHYTTYLYISKNVFMYLTRPHQFRGNSAYFTIRDEEDFNFQVKEKAYHLLL